MPSKILDIRIFQPSLVSYRLPIEEMRALRSLLQTNYANSNDHIIHEFRERAKCEQLNSSSSELEFFIHNFQERGLTISMEAKQHLLFNQYKWNQII